MARLVREHGSDDKLVQAVNAKLGTRLTRQMVIRWRNGETGISKQWAERLAAFAGGSPDDWRPVKSSVERRLDELERRISRLEHPATS